MNFPQILRTFLMFACISLPSFALFAQTPCGDCNQYTGQDYADCIATCGGGSVDDVPINQGTLVLVLIGLTYFLITFYRVGESEFFMNFSHRRKLIYYRRFMHGVIKIGQ